MPVNILTPHQRRQYGRFTASISPEQIAKHCYLTPSEISQVVIRRPQAWQQLGYAIQLMTVRYLGTFLELKETLKVPKILMTFAAQQLQLHEIPDMTRYRTSIQLISTHRDSIRAQFGYTDFSESQVAYETWLKARILRAQDSELELFDLSTAWCVEQKILLPAATTLERVIASIHGATLQGLWSSLANIAIRAGRSERLLALLDISEETGRSLLEDLQRAPKRQSTTGIQDSEKRINQFKKLGVSELDLSAFPAVRIRQMADYAVLSKTSQMAALHITRRLATLLAFVAIYEVIAMDDFVDLFDVLMTMLMSNS